MGFRSGEYFGRKKSLAWAERMSWCMALLLRLPRFSMTTISPGAKERPENLLDIGEKALAIDGSFDEPWRIDPVIAQGRQESHGLPAAMRNFGEQPVASRCPSPQGSHVGPGPGLVDADQPLSSDAIDILSIGSAAARPRDDRIRQQPRFS